MSRLRNREAAGSSPAPGTFLGGLMTYHGGYERSASYYDLFDNKPNIAFFTSYIDSDSVVADIGAGTGRLTLPLSHTAAHVYAVEPSPAMRTILAYKVADLSTVTVIGAEAQSFFVPTRCDVAVLSGVYDHLLTDEERIASLNAIHRCLKRDGTLLFDAFVGAPSSSPMRMVDRCTEDKTTHVRYIGRHPLENGVVEVTLRYESYRDGMLVRCADERSLVSASTYGAVAQMLEHTGFECVHAWGDYGNTPYDGASDTVVVEASRS